MRRGGVPAGKTYQNPTSGPNASAQNFQNQAAATGQSQMRDAAQGNNFMGDGLGQPNVMPTSANMINTGGPMASDAGASRGTMRQTTLGMPEGDGPVR